MLFRPGYNIDEHRRMWRQIEEANPRMRPSTRRNLKAWLFTYLERARVVGPRRGWWDSFLAEMSKESGLTVKETRNVLAVLERAGLTARERAGNGADKRADYKVNITLCNYDVLFCVPIPKGQSSGQSNGQANGQSNGQHEDSKVKDSKVKDPIEKDSKDEDNNTSQTGEPSNTDKADDVVVATLVKIGVSKSQIQKWAGRQWPKDYFTVDQVIATWGYAQEKAQSGKEVGYFIRCFEEEAAIDPLKPKELHPPPSPQPVKPQVERVDDATWDRAVSASDTETWAGILAKLKERIQPVIFESFFDGKTALQSLECGRLSILARDQHVADWIGEHYKAVIQAVAEDLTGDRPEIEINMPSLSREENAVSAANMEAA